MKIKILEVGIDVVNLKEVLNKISEFLESEKQNYIVTVNAEFIVEAHKNADFRRFLNNANLSICDGSGPEYASFKKLKRVTGVDLVAELLRSNGNEKIFLLGGEEGSAKELMKKYPKKVVGAERGGKIGSDFILSDNQEMIEKINASGANILLVGFGQVKQEMWIDKNLSKIPNIKVAIGVGGTFDFLSGNVKRAPKWMRKLGLEWLFRLLYQPARVGRIFNALVVFGWLIFLSFFNKKK